MTITFKAFLKKFEALEANFGFKTNAILLPLIHGQLKDLSDDDFSRGFNAMMSKTRQEWGEVYNYGKTPTVADWPNLWSVKRKLTTQDTAKMEVEKILDNSRHYSSKWQPDHPTTKRVLKSQSLDQIHFDIHDRYNDNLKNKSFYTRDLIQKWLACNDLEADENLEIISSVKRLLPNFKTPLGLNNK
tara:strand:+ start:22 stop:582 length:561 start_codon:yes stop_codon:yes gene_type:complete